MQKYTEYKDSGVEWLGEIPSHWNEIKLKINSTIYNGDSLNENKKAKYESDDESHLAYISSKDIDLDTSIISYENGLRIPKNESKYKVAKSNSSLICIEGGSAGRKIAFTNQDVCFVNKLACVSAKNNVNSKYLFYTLKGSLFQTQFKLAMSGMIGGVAISSINNFYILEPSLPEQTAIANFLDLKTAQIDNAISVKQKQIELLKERRQILIHKAVTRGLNPNAKIKDSGVEWIGEIPEGWEVKALKHIANLQSGETISPDKFVDDENGFPVYGGNGFRGYTSSYTNEGEFALIGRQGALCGNINYAKGKFYASEHAIVVYPLNKENVLWLGETIKIANFNRLSQSAAQPGIAVNVVKNVMFPYPPIIEQNKISEYIEITTTKIATAIALKEKEIDKLKEYKATLINGAVTGKIKVV